jgi:N-acetylglutamate synthase-like GNAT family acetyltransferase
MTPEDLKQFCLSLRSTGAVVRMLLLDMDDGREAMHLSFISVPAKNRRQGYGSSAIRRICARADSEGLPVYIPKVGDRRGVPIYLPREILFPFYERFGFTRVSEESMLREPQAKCIAPADDPALLVNVLRE